LIAAAVIAKEPEKYGFGSIILEEPIRFTEINVPPATPLNTIARASLLDVAVVRSYNPELIRGITPPGKNDYEIKLPYSISTLQFSERLESILDGEPKIRSIVSYKVKKRDTLTKIAKKYGVSSDDILLVNNCEEKLRVKPGMVIAVPRFTGPSKVVVAKDLDKNDAKPAPVERERVRVAKEDTQAKQARSKTHHIVKKGETLTSISDKYGVAINDLKSFNKLKNGKIYPNMKLRLASHVEKKSKAKVRFHIVKKGETLTSISDKYGVNVEAIKSANRLKSNKIQARMRLKIVTGEG
jgi:membrane-bound lytic murein transglycosylase D